MTPLRKKLLKFFGLYSLQELDIIEQIMIDDETRSIHKLKISKDGSLLRNGEAARIRLAHLIEAIGEVSPIAYRYIKHVKSWSQLNSMCLRMHIGASPFDDPGLEITGRIKEELYDIANAIKGLTNTLKDDENISKRDKKKKVGWGYWDFCEFCWRLTPRDVIGRYVKQLKCSVHQDITHAEYKRLRRLKPARTEEGAQKTNHYAITRSQVMKEAQGLLLESPEVTQCPDHHELFQPTPSFDPLNIPEDNQDLSEVWKVFTETAKYLERHGADLSNFLSVMQTLDDTDSPHDTRNKIHTGFSRAPALAKGVLVEAETWLRINPKEK